MDSLGSIKGFREDFPMSLLQQVSLLVEAGFGLWGGAGGFMLIHADPRGTV